MMLDTILMSPSDEYIFVFVLDKKKKKKKGKKKVQWLQPLLHPMFTTDHIAIMSAWHSQTSHPTLKQHSLVQSIRLQKYP